VPRIETASAAGELLRERIGTNDMTVLLVGHGTAGLTLIRHLAPDPVAAHHMGNTHLWRASYTPEGGFKLKYHDLPATEGAKR
jgi:broad specificity phosphatase PhoE